MKKDRTMTEDYKYAHEECSSECESSCEHEHECNASVTNECHCTCESTKVCPKPDVWGCLIIKTPVVLAETTISIPIISKIKLEEKAAEIKRIRKNVFVKQCHLIPGSVTHCMPPYASDTAPMKQPPYVPCTGVLVVSGFVRKNIEYATRDCTGRGVMSGRIKHTTVDVPFTCTTTVTFDIEPLFIPNENPREIGTFHTELKCCDPCGENVLGSNPCERNFTHTEVFNERVFCELICAKIFESDIANNPEFIGCHSPNELSFNEITEKMVVNLTLKLLQKRQVKIDER